jgi:glycerol-3-phosphate dehydrogenase (NAD(P)+)
VVASINDHHRNALFLSDVDLPPSLRASGDLAAAIAGANIVVSAVPTQFLRTTFTSVADAFGPVDAIVSVSKGIEVGTSLTPTQVLGEVLRIPPDLIALSGPSFAAEVAVGSPTMVVAAGHDGDLVKRVQVLFSDERFRVYASDDIVSVELGGALKNVIAIATGIANGLGYGHNTRAALITRGLAEITRLGVAMGGKPLTFSGLSGMGDLVLTCSGDLSRNRQVGLALGRGQTIEQILEEMDEVAEGVKTTAAVHQLAADAGIEMPIAEQVYRVLYEGAAPRESIVALMTRKLRSELD